jgi:predicted transcriptional regulator
MKKKKTQLTKAETQVMNSLWQLPEMNGTSADIMALMPEPKPAPTTLLTFLKILTEKGFVRTERMGKSNRFTALVSHDEYAGEMVKDLKDSFFSGSFASLVSFFAKQEKLSDKEINELVALIKNSN